MTHEKLIIIGSGPAGLTAGDLVAAVGSTDTLLCRVGYWDRNGSRLGV